MTADQIPSTEGDPKFTQFFLLLFDNILFVKYVFKRVSERLGEGYLKDWGRAVA
jgi:hypothetical protein